MKFWTNIEIFGRKPKLWSKIEIFGRKPKFWSKSSKPRKNGVFANSWEEDGGDEEGDEDDDGSGSGSDSSDPDDGAEDEDDAIAEMEGKHVPGFFSNVSYISIFGTKNGFSENTGTFLIVFDKNVDFQPKLRFSTKISIFQENFYFNQNYDSRPKLRFSAKISIFS